MYLNPAGGAVWGRGISCGGKQGWLVLIVSLTESRIRPLGTPVEITLTVLTRVGRVAHCGQHNSLAGILNCMSGGRGLSCRMHPSLSAS